MSSLHKPLNNLNNNNNFEQYLFLPELNTLSERGLVTDPVVLRQQIIPLAGMNPHCLLLCGSRGLRLRRCHLLREKEGTLVFMQVMSRIKMRCNCRLLLLFLNRRHLEMRLRTSMNRDRDFLTINRAALIVPFHKCRSYCRTAELFDKGVHD